MINIKDFLVYKANNWCKLISTYSQKSLHQNTAYFGKDKNKQK